MEKAHVLYIDDEVNNLNAFRAIFRRQYKIYTSSNTLEARNILKEKDIHVIISDQKMPETTGVEFFNIIKEEYPGPKRILLTAFSDIDAAIAAINKGHIFKYIKKPWEDYELENAINSGFQLYVAQMEMEKKVKAMERINHVINKVMYDASHALNSNLLSSMGIIKLSHSDPDFKDPGGYLHIIEKNLLRSFNLLQYLGEYYQHTRQQPEYKKVDFYVLIQEAFESCRVSETGIKFQPSIEQETDFYNDNFRLTVVFKYLITNIIQNKREDESGGIVPFSIIVKDDQAIVELGDGKVEVLNNQLLELFYPTEEEDRYKKDPMSEIELYIIKKALNGIGGQAKGDRKDPDAKTRLTLTIPNTKDGYRPALE